MNLIFEKEVENDLEKIKENVRKRIVSKINNLEKEPLPKNSYVIHLLDGTEVQCLKLQEKDRNSDLNHRVTYDIEGENVRIFGVFPRKPGYHNIKEETNNRR